MTTSRSRDGIAPIPMLHRWWLNDRASRVSITPAGVSDRGELLDARAAAAVVDAAIDDGPVWSIDAREVEDCARFVVMRYGAHVSTTEARAVVREALALGLLRAWRHRAPQVAAPFGELPLEALMSVPLATDLIASLYEKGVEVVDELVDEGFGAVEFEARVDDDACDAVEETAEVEDEGSDAIELEDQPRDVGVRGDPVTGAAAPSDGEASEGVAEAEHEAVVEDDACDAVEDEARCEDVEDAPCGDAVEPTDHPAAAAA